MQLDLERVPFSRFGSYMAFSLLPAEGLRPAGLYLRSVHGPATGGRPMQELLRLELVQDNQPIPFKVLATFTQLKLVSPIGTASLCLPDSSSICVHLENVSLRLQGPAGAYDTLAPGPENTWRLILTSTVESKFQFTPLHGRITADAPWQAEHCESISLTLSPGVDKIGEFTIQESIINWPGPRRLSFEESLQGVEVDLAAFCSKVPTVPDIYEETRQMAGYVLWSNVVEPQGMLTRPAIFASKNGMIGTWSWDHAFHSLALVESHPQLAWAQLMVIFDQQDISGALPDLLNDRLISWSFCKPPIHGLILSRLLQNSNFLTLHRLKEIYPHLVNWTNWWFEHRDDNQNGLPHYYHGNDSGWDNCTVFRVRPPVESPDLAAYLVRQMDFLAEAATRLGKSEEAQIWRKRANQLIERLMAQFWRKDHFVAIEIHDRSEIEAESLLLYLPLVLGPRLPLRVRATLISRLKEPGTFLSPFGLATENQKSPFYRARGYWRGPIWPAPTLLLIDALKACGENNFAQTLRLQFCNLVKQSGMAENFDAQTGEGYHDFHFSWTASIFLVLAHELLMGDRESLSSQPKDHSN